MTISQLVNPATGKAVNNHILQHDDGGVTLYSYGIPVARVIADKLILAPRAMEHSRTTSKYVCLFAHEFLPEAQSRWRVPADLRKSVKAGEIDIVSL